MKRQTEKPKRTALQRIFSRYDGMSVEKSLIPALCLSVAISFLVMLYGPLELFFTNVHEFYFTFGMLFPVLLKGFAVMLLACMLGFLLCYVIYVRLYELALLAAGVGYLCTYIQGMFLAGNLPPLDGRTMRWWIYGKENLQSVILWCAVVLLTILLVRFLHMRRMYKVLTWGPAFLTAVLLLTGITVGLMNHGFSLKPQTLVTKDGEFTMSSDRNLVVFVVDTVDSWTWKELMEGDYPEFAEILSDFTYFPDTESAYPYTTNAIPNLLEGQWFENQEDFRTFVTRAMDDSPLLARLRQDGYRMGVYSEELVYESDNVLQFENVKKAHCQFTSDWDVMKMELKLVWFKYAPFPAKKYVPISWDDFHGLMTLEGSEQYWETNWNFYQDLLAAEPQVVGDKCFRFLHIEGAHWPFRYDPDVNVVNVYQGSYYESMAATMKIVDTYLDMLREAGVYDNTAILVLSDHGFGYANGEEVPLGRNNPFLAVKGINEHHDAMQISGAPISYEDLQEAYRRLLDGATSDQVFDAKEGDDRVRRYLYYEFTKEDHMVEYELHGHAEDHNNLVPTGRVFDLEG